MRIFFYVSFVTCIFVDVSMVMRVSMIILVSTIKLLYSGVSMIIRVC